MKTLRVDPKNSKIFNSSTMQAVSAFCESKEIKDLDNFMYLCFKQGFDIKKYGLIGGETTKEVIKEVEKIVEVPVEVIKEVEKIVEVPVDRIVEVIKEIPIEKIVTKIEYISDKTGENELIEKIEQLEKEMSKKNEELDEVRRNLDIILDKPPVEIIKEVEVIKEIENNEKLKMMGETLQNLRSELQEKNEKIKELEKINRELLNGNQNQAYLLRGSNLNRRL